MGLTFLPIVCFGPNLILNFPVPSVNVNCGVIWQSKRDKNIKKQTQLCNPTGILDNCKLNCAKVQRLWMLPTQLCKSTKVVDTANSTVQKYKGHACCNLKCAILQGYWITANSAAQLSLQLSNIPVGLHS